MGEVQRWLQSISLGEYASTFEAAGYYEVSECARARARNTPLTFAHSPLF